MEHSRPKSWCSSVSARSCILALLLTVMHSCSSISARFLGNETDRIALIDMKVQLNDPNGFLNSWNDSQHHCQWSGVSCDMQHGRVTALSLGGKSLSGTISPRIGNLSFMKFIHLEENSLHGGIPQQIGQLSRLRVFNLSNNLLSGEIPLNLTTCSKLRYISLYNNQLTGKIPTELGSLAKLETLFLHGNNLTGSIPASLGNMSSSLMILTLGTNNLEGHVPAEIGSLSRLALFVLEVNMLGGEIPSSLFNISTLIDVSVASNFFSGKFPINFGHNLPHLRGFYLGMNNFSGESPVSITNCTNLQTLDLGGNKFEGKFPPSVGMHSRKSLYIFNVSRNKLSGRIPPTIGDCSKIISLEMNNNHLSGSLPPSLASLKGIEYLDFSDNTLTGKIPLGLSHLVYLAYLNLSYNDLEGEVPTTGVFSNGSLIMLQGNDKLCGGIFELGLPPCPIVHTKTKGKKHLKIILIPLLLALVVSISVFMYLFYRKISDRVRTQIPSLPSEGMLRVTYHDLYRATNEFSPANLIGSGSFGFVYKGVLVLEHGDTKIVAVKVLDLQRKGASKSFKAECKALSNLRHRNLVPLLTYCSTIDHKGHEFKALVYKYMENGNLDTWLHPDQPHEPTRCVNLLQRINVVIDVASALDHLHNHSHIAVAHCDIKPSNILLDDELTAYVGDFGLARLLSQLQQGASSNTVIIKGTIGYAAPEYAMGMEVSTRGDVYSYGILLLEMFTRRRPTDDAFTEGLDLHSFVEAGLNDQVWKIVDPWLLSGEEQVETKLKEQECIISVLKLGIGCSQGAARDRIDMKEVTRKLHFIRDSLRLR